MPELPEVETTRRGIAPYIEGAQVVSMVVRHRGLRWPIAPGLEEVLVGQSVLAVDRRAKYLLLRMGRGTLLIHLGMSGNLRLVTSDAAPGKHDHVDLLLNSGQMLRFNDPRRFGAVLWAEGDVVEHSLLASLGPEPLSELLSGDYLFARSRGRRQAVKLFMMDNRIVVGVGNIYANEALFSAGVDPRRAAGRVSLDRYRRLADCVKAVLSRAIEQGGTTLRDFVGGDGKPGYFQQQLQVYGRDGLPCVNCSAPLKRIVLGQRASVYCPVCQR